MPFNDPPEIHGGLRVEAAGPVSAGVRRRGRDGKPTGFVAIDDSIYAQFVKGRHLRMMLGGGKDYGQVMFVAVPEPERANVNPKLSGKQWFIETRKIPLGAIDQPVKKTGVDYKFTEDGNAIIVTLPWLEGGGGEL